MTVIKRTYIPLREELYSSGNVGPHENVSVTKFAVPATIRDHILYKKFLVASTEQQKVSALDSLITYSREHVKTFYQKQLDVYRHLEKLEATRSAVSTTGDTPERHTAQLPFLPDVDEAVKRELQAAFDQTASNRKPLFIDAIIEKTRAKYLPFEEVEMKKQQDLFTAAVTCLMDIHVDAAEQRYDDLKELAALSNVKEHDAVSSAPLPDDIISARGVIAALQRVRLLEGLGTIGMSHRLREVEEAHAALSTIPEHSAMNFKKALLVAGEALPKREMRSRFYQKLLPQLMSEFTPNKDHHNDEFRLDQLLTLHSGLVSSIETVAGQAQEELIEHAYLTLRHLEDLHGQLKLPSDEHAALGARIQSNRDQLAFRVRSYTTDEWQAAPLNQALSLMLHTARPVAPPEAVLC